VPRVSASFGTASPDRVSRQRSRERTGARSAPAYHREACKRLPAGEPLTVYKFKREVESGAGVLAAVQTSGQTALSMPATLELGWIDVKTRDKAVTRA